MAGVLCYRETRSQQQALRRPCPLSLVSLVLALLIEQARPLQYRQIVFGPVSRLADMLDGLFNAGEKKHGVVAWLIGVGVARDVSPAAAGSAQTAATLKKTKE